MLFNADHEKSEVQSVEYDTICVKEERRGRNRICRSHLCKKTQLAAMSREGRGAAGGKSGRLDLGSF